MKRTTLVLVLGLSLAGPVQLAWAQEMDLGGDVSQYRQFLIHPHVQRGLAALDRGDAASAVQSFLRAREHAPTNATTALYLARAYDRSGQRDKALAVLEGQQRHTPGDARLENARRALGAGMDAGTAATVPSTDRPVLGPVGVVPVASQEAAALRQQAQRAIHDGDRALARRRFATIDADGGLTPAEQQQWFNLQLADGDVAAARQLQDRAGLDGPVQQLAVAEALAVSGNLRELAAFMGEPQPTMQPAKVEQRWIGLLAVAAQRNPAPLLGYRVSGASTRVVYARAALPFAQARGDERLVARLLSALPSNDLLQARFAHALATGDRVEARRTGLALGRRAQGMPGQVDAVSFSLVHAGAAEAAIEVLAAALPFSGLGESEILYARLAGLLAEDPARLTPDLRKQLRDAGSGSGPRSGPVVALAAGQDCEGVDLLMSDRSGAHSAQAWASLADCKAGIEPGVAAFALSRAVEIDPANRQTRAAYAYAAYAAGDFGASLQAWRSIPMVELTPGQLLSASETALAAGDEAIAAAFLDAYAASAAPLDDRYWWLRARAMQGEDPVRARQALELAIELQPRPAYYSRLAGLQQQAGQQPQARASLLQALALDPDDLDLHAALAYAYLDADQPALAQVHLIRLRQGHPQDARWAEQLAYVHRDRGELALARAAAADAIDLLAGNTHEIDRLFRLRRMHEQLGRRWAFNADITLGDTGTGSAGTNSATGGTAYRSYVQVEAQYRFGSLIGREDHDALSVYARVFAGSGPQGKLLPRNDVTLGAGLRWKPLRDRTFYLAAEQQVPLQDGGRSDLLLRASASPLSDPRYADDWHAGGEGWLAHSVFLDAGHYTRSGNSFFTADYQLGLHRKIADSSTLEPFARLQYNGQYIAAGFRDDLRTGIGLRLNQWYGERGRDAFRRRFSVALEWQEPLDTYLDDSGTLLLSAGHRW